MIKTDIFNIKTEIFDIQQIKFEKGDTTAPENLVVQLKVSYSDCKNKWLRHLIGELSDEFIDVIKNIKYAYRWEKNTDRFGEDYLYEEIAFVYPEMSKECKILMEKLFFRTEDYPSWVKSKVYADDPETGHRVFVGYSTNYVLVQDKDCEFLGNMLYYKQTGWISGDVKYRVYLK